LPSKSGLDLGYLIDFYKNLNNQQVNFFNDDNFFNLLAGTDQLKKMIKEGKDELEIKALWEPALIEYKLMRKKYLLYN